METKEAKQRIREQLKQARLRLSSQDASKLSQQIVNNLIDQIDWPLVSSVHLYLPINKLNEVDTWPFLSWLHENHPKNSTYTSMYSKGKPITHVHIRSSTKYKTKKDGIPLPVENYQESETPYDLIIVPMLGFDQGLNRIGYGRAVYDHFLRSHPEAQKVGLCYEMGKVEDGVPTEEHDQKLDKIVTETEIYQ